MSLDGKQKRYLRSLAHHLEPVVQLGKHGVTPAVVEATRAALLTHELIKVRRSKDCPSTRKEIGVELSQALAADVAGEIGHTVLFYKAHPEKPRIELPSAAVTDPAADP
jgi:RNA-binding protein